MALNKNALKNNIKTLMSEMRERTENADEEYADRLATAIDDYVKQAKIVYQTGLTAPQGPVTGVFQGNLE